MKTIDGQEIKGIPKDIMAKMAYMEIALKYLADNKGFTLHIDSCKEIDDALCPRIYGETYGDASFSFNINNTEFNDDPVFHGNEPHFNDWSYEKRLVLRLARYFFEGYGNWKECQQQIKQAAVTASVDPLTISKINIGSAVYDICDSRVNSLSSTLDEAEQRINELENRNEQLEKEVQELKAMKDLMLDVLQQKGLL